MARNGSGVYSLYTPGNPVVAGTTIDPVAFNNTTTDLATAMTNSVARNGEGVPTANWPMATFKLTGLGNGTTAGDSLAYGQSLPATTFSGLITASAGIADGSGNTYAQAVVKSKAASTSRSSTTTLTNDPDLVAALSVGVWQYKVFLPIACAASGSGNGFKAAMSFSGTATGGGYFNSDNALITNPGAAGGTLYMALGGGGVAANSTINSSGGPAQYMAGEGSITVTVAGNLALQWAQNSSGAQNLTVFYGAFLTCTKVG